MGRCGIATMTCLLLLLCMAAIYVSAVVGEVIDEPDVLAEDLPILMHVRKERSLRNYSNSRGRQGRIADGTIDENGLGSRGGGNRLGRGRRRRIGARAGRVARIEGVSRRDMNLARKLHNASSPFGNSLLTTAFGPEVRYNTILSPYSVHTALAMTSLGARRGTQREILATLGLPQTGLRRRMIHRAYKALIRLLSLENENTRLDTANAVYVKPHIPLEANFRQGLIENYNATFDVLDLGAPGGPEAPINQWVSQATQGNIPSLLGPGTITRATAMVLLNAVYFKAAFRKAFRPAVMAPFTTFGGDVKNILTMTVSDSFRYADHLDTQVIEIPYNGGNHALYILLPHESSNVNQLLASIADKDRFGINPLNNFLSDLQPTSMIFSMPKFQIDSGSMSLREHLITLGISKAFGIGRRADFSGISPSHLTIQDVIHKATIEISEEGTEASAATAVIFAESASFQPLEIAANRPFLFIVLDTQLKTSLFMGTFMGQTRQEVEN